MRVAVLHNAVSEHDSLEDQDVLVQAEVISQALRQLGHEPLAVPCTLDLAAMRDALRRLAPALVFNLVESLDGADSLSYLATAVLDAMNQPYTGNPTEATFLTTHKPLAKERLAQAGLPTPAWLGAGLGQTARFCGGLGDGAFRPGAWIIKGVWEQASRNLDEEAIVTVADESELCRRLQEQTARVGRPCFAEQFIAGREFNLAGEGALSPLAPGGRGVGGEGEIKAEGGGRRGEAEGTSPQPPPPQVLPPAEIDFSAFPPGKARIVGYRAKWEADSFEFQNTPRRFDFPAAEMPLLAHLQSLACDCWRLFGLRGYVRVDFRVDQAGQPWILEVNTNPCLSPDAGFAATLKQAAIPFDQAIARILEASLTIL